MLSGTRKCQFDYVMNITAHKKLNNARLCTNIMSVENETNNRSLYPFHFLIAWKPECQKIVISIIYDIGMS